MSFSEEERQKVLIALENDNYKWRTIDGISKDTQLTAEKVLEILSSMPDNIVKSSIPSVDGKALCTTRNHFRKHATITEKFLGSIKNRVV